MTKTQQIKKHLILNGSITSWEAIELYRETRLAAIICSLRKRGWHIASIWEEGKDTYGNDSRWVEYRLRGLPPV